MYNDHVDINIRLLNETMPLQIANPTVVAKVARLARILGLTKTAAVERAVDALLVQDPGDEFALARLTSLLAQLDRIPDREDAYDPLEWDRAGLPQ